MDAGGRPRNHGLESTGDGWLYDAVTRMDQDNRIDGSDSGADPESADEGKDQAETGPSARRLRAWTGNGYFRSYNENNWPILWVLFFI